MATLVTPPVCPWSVCGLFEGPEEFDNKIADQKDGGNDNDQSRIETHGETTMDLSPPPLLMRILYLHGLGDRSGGALPRFLESHDWTVIEPDLPDLDFDECLRVAQQAFDQSQPDALIGYSQGGAAAMNIDTGDTPQILISPSWKYRGPATTVKPRTIIVNPHDDALVPLQDVRELLELSGLTERRHLVVAGKWHGAFDEKTLEVIREVVIRAVTSGS